jgi:uncharacterized cupredoxin-like copper-binding protein/Cu/Ag efflux protein CusF
MKKRGYSMRLVLLIVALGVGALVAPALAHDDDESTPYGEPGMASMANRTVTVTMSDTMRFTPDAIAVKEGETIRFIVKNAGTIRHEMMIGTIAELKEHADLMRQFPEMEHEDSNAVTVEPGKEGEIAWRFTVPGTFDFACLIPGHYESGMKGRIVVGSPPQSAPPAAAHSADHAGMAMPPKPALRQDGQIGHGEGDVRRVDKANGKITLRHGPLVGLKDADGKDMPGMTMVFGVADPARLDSLQAGDKVRFTVARDKGALVIRSIEPMSESKR